MPNAKSFPAKYPGTCSCCGASFGPGATIVYAGRQATLLACVEAELADLKRQDAEDSIRLEQGRADWVAGRCMKVEPGPKELMIRNAPSYEMARTEAFAVVASITAAGGKAKILRHKGHDGKWHVGRTVVSYYGASSLGHQEGWAFKWACETA